MVLGRLEKVRDYGRNAHEGEERPLILPARTYNNLFEEKLLASASRQSASA